MVAAICLQEGAELAAVRIGGEAMSRRGVLVNIETLDDVVTAHLGIWAASRA